MKINVEALDEDGGETSQKKRNSGRKAECCAIMSEGVAEI